MYINPRLHVFDRSEQCVQFGVGEQSVILDGLTVPDKRLINLLIEGTDEPESALAGKCGLLPARAGYLIRMLQPVLITPSQSETVLSGLRADRLEPDIIQWSAAYELNAAPLMERRNQAAVRIMGLGRTGSTIAQALAAAGIGTLLLDDNHRVGPADVGAGSFRLCDVGMPRAAAVRRQIQHIDPTIQTHAIGQPGQERTYDASFFTLDLVIHIANDITDEQLHAELMHKEQPHLPVILRDRDVLVGPLVVPGKTACLGCIDQHRADQDPQWLEICRTMRARAVTETGAAPEETAVALFAAGSAVLQSLLLIDGVNRPSGWSTVVQMRTADGSSTSFSYQPHPACGCTHQPSAASAAG
ncbi:MAG TPA: ThiF family adenylyltransferase [Arthrobacter sp.]|nr:ThiF family adenylyltransferase [Arthrobacter sp.]